MAGPKDKRTEKSAASSFFGDAEMDDWLADEDDLGAEAAPSAGPELGLPAPAVAAPPEPTPVEPEPEAPVEAAVAEAPPEPEPVIAAATVPEAEAVPEAPPEEAPPVEVEAAPAAEPAPTAEATTSGSVPALRAPVAPPPPPRFSGGRRPGKAVAPSGFLDSILPRTLEPPSAATGTPRSSPPETLVGLDAGGPHAEAHLPATGPEGWREAVGVLEAEADHAADAATLRVDAALVRLRCLGDVAGARAALAAVDGGDAAAWELRAELASDASEAFAAWSALAGCREGVGAAEAWRRAAEFAPSDEARADALAQATAADPTDVAAWDDRLELARRSGDALATLAALEGMSGQIQADLGPDLDAERAATLWRLGRLDEARDAAVRALAAAPEHGGAAAVLDGVQYALGDATGRAAHLDALAVRAVDDVGAWAWQAARAWRDAGDAVAAADAYDRAVVAGFAPARVEREAWLLASDAPERLAAGLADDDVAGAWRLAVALDRAGRAPDVVRTLYGRVAAAGVGVVHDLLDGVLRRAGDHEGRIAALKAVVAAWDVPRTPDLVRLAEALEAADPASPEALDRFGEAAERGDLDGLRGVARVARALGRSDRLAVALATLAELEPDPAIRAARATEAGQALLAAGKVEEGVALLERAALGEGGRVLALEATTQALVGARRPLDAADRVEAHAKELSGEACAPWWLAGARLRAAAGDDAGAVRALDALLEACPGHEGALRRLGGSIGVATPERLRERLLAEGTPLAVELAHGLDQVAGLPLSDDTPADLRSLSAARDDDGWRAWLAAAADAGDPQARVAWCALTASVEPEAVAAWLDAADGPRSSLLAHVAERLGRGGRAFTFAPETGGADALRRAAAAGVWAPLVEASEGGRLPVARAVDLARAPVAAEVRVDALAEAIEACTSPGLAAMLAGEAAALHAAAGRPAAAAQSWLRVLAARPGSPGALSGVVTALAAARDVDGLASLAARGVAVLPRARALALDAADGPVAVEAWKEAAGSGALVDRLGLEGALVRTEAWAELYASWTARRETTSVPDERERLDRRRRWLLAEKLAASELAWDLYTRLHEEQPEDRETTENLARIAGARGDVDTASRYLRELVASASGPSEAAQALRRLSEVLVGAGRLDEARQALLDALAQAPEDLASLDALRSLAERTGDGETLLVALQREAALVDEERRADVYREIARVAAVRPGDQAQAVEAWRSVLVAVPGDLEALRGLVALAERAGDDAGLLDAGAELAALTGGEERAALLRRLGERCLAAGRDEEGISFLERAVQNDPPDVRAAELLADAYRQHHDHEGLVRALLAQAAASDDEGLRVDRLREAARIEAEVQLDREAAHNIYAGLLDLRHDDVEALRFEARYLADRDERLAAIAAHERLLGLVEGVEDLADPDVLIEQTGLHHRLGELLLAEGRVDEAKARLEAALALNPHHLPTLELIGPRYVEDQDWTRAGEVYARQLLLTGGRGEPERVADVHTMLGMVDLQQGREEKALRRLHRALETFPNFVPALKGLARVHEGRSDWQAALTAHNSVIYNATVPDDVTRAYVTKGRILDERLGRPDKAAQHYERSLAFEADQPWTYLRLAELALRDHQWEDAIDTAARGLTFAERDRRAAAELQLVVTIARVRSDDLDGARAAADAVEALEPELAEAAALALDTPDAAAAALRERLAS